MAKYIIKNNGIKFNQRNYEDIFKKVIESKWSSKFHKICLKENILPRYTDDKQIVNSYPDESHEVTKSVFRCEKNIIKCNGQLVNISTSNKINVNLRHYENLSKKVIDSNHKASKSVKVTQSREFTIFQVYKKCCRSE